MKLHQQSNPNLNTVTAYGEGYLDINRVRYTHSVYLSAEGTVSAWPPLSLSELTLAHCQALIQAKPELVLLGTGQQQRFPHPELLRPFIEAGIGIEIMDTAAASRTFNILAAEGRQVTAALILTTTFNPEVAT